MIRVTNFNNANGDNNKYDINWAIVIHVVGKVASDNKWDQVSDLAPDEKLFGYYTSLNKQHKFDHEAFFKGYFPQFMNTLAYGKNSASAREKLSYLCEQDKAGKKIRLACYCGDETLCHRSIIAGILQGSGCNVITDTGMNYCDYYGIKFSSSPAVVRSQSMTAESQSTTFSKNGSFALDHEKKMILPVSVSANTDSSDKKSVLSASVSKNDSMDPSRDGVISSFRGEYAFLSNMHACPIRIGNVDYTNAEAAFHSFKTQIYNEKIMFSNLSGPDAKSLGSKQGLNGQHIHFRSDWDSMRVQVMKLVVREKFKQNPELARKLVSTGNAELVEGDTWGDSFWGVNQQTGQGENMLGKILMDVRDELESSPDFA